MLGEVEALESREELRRRLILLQAFLTPAFASCTV
jgi:hypothetical protein